MKTASGTVEFDDVKMTPGQLPTGVSAFGRSSPSCRGPVGISVTSVPRIGNAASEFTCRNAPPSAMGWFILGARALTPPVVVLGVDLLIDPNGAFFLLTPVRSHATGVSSFATPIPQNGGLVGVNVNAQFAWSGPTSPPPCPPLGLSATNALSITIQP